MRRFCLSLFMIMSFLMNLQAFAAGKTDKVTLDSLWRVALRHSGYCRFDESNAVFHKILKDFKLDRRSKRELFERLGNNALLAGDYKSCYRYMLSSYGRRNTAKFRSMKILAELPPESVSRKDEDIEVNFFIDSLYLDEEFKGCELRLPVKIGGMEEMLILDNGAAKFSVASESFAQNHGIRLVGAESTSIGTVAEVPMQIGIADSLSIGSLTFFNIIFSVIPDIYLENPVLNINALLGANIFRLAGEMDFDTRKRTVVFPAVQRNMTPNLTINTAGEHYVDVGLDGDTLQFQLDLGAARTHLGANYFQKYEDYITKSCRSDSVVTGGVGGASKELIYIIEDLTFSLCGGDFKKMETSVSVKRSRNEGREFGKIGNDFILYFEKVALNIEKMFLYVESGNGHWKQPCAPEYIQ